MIKSKKISVIFSVLFFAGMSNGYANDYRFGELGNVFQPIIVHENSQNNLGTYPDKEIVIDNESGNITFTPFELNSLDEYSNNGAAPVGDVQMPENTNTFSLNGNDIKTNPNGIIIKMTYAMPSNSSINNSDVTKDWFEDKIGGDHKYANYVYAYNITSFEYDKFDSMIVAFSGYLNFKFNKVNYSLPAVFGYQYYNSGWIVAFPKTLCDIGTNNHNKPGYGVYCEFSKINSESTATGGVCFNDDNTKGEEAAYKFYLHVVSSADQCV